MFYFIYTMLGSLCIFFSCINLLPEKLSLSCRLLLLFWTLLSSQILNQLLGQYFVFITLPVILLILYPHLFQMALPFMLHIWISFCSNL